MWIHIPSNETAWEIWGQGKSVCVNKGNLWGRTRADIEQEVTTSKGESAKEVMIRKMHSPRQAILILTAQELSIQHEWSPYLAETFPNKVTSAWQNRQETDQEIFFQAIAGNSCLIGQLLPRLLWVQFCRFVFAFAFSLHPASTNAIVLPSILPLITIVANTQLDSHKQKDKNFCVFSSTTWDRYKLLNL